jgi:hypothetical protein
MRLIIPVVFALFVASCGDSNQAGADNGTDSSVTTSDSANAGSMAANTLTDTEKNEGWQLLFDGQTKNGWHSYNNTGNLASWKVEDGALFLDVDTNGEHTGEDMVTDEEYENFHLKIDWKISKNGNSGIIFSVKESPKYANDYFTGPEMQVLDNDGHADGKIVKHRAGDLYDLITSSPETVKPVGEWNTAEVYKNGDTLELRLNGPTVVKTTLWNDNWKKLVAGSKFKQWPDFGTFKSGKIALQDHGNKVWYRNIKIRKL